MFSHWLTYSNSFVNASTSTVPLLSRSNIAAENSTKKFIMKTLTTERMRELLTNHKLAASVRETFAFSILQSSLQFLCRNAAGTIGVDGIEHVLNLWWYAWSGLHRIIMIENWVAVILHINHTGKLEWASSVSGFDTYCTVATELLWWLLATWIGALCLITSWWIISWIRTSWLLVASWLLLTGITASWLLLTGITTWIALENGKLTSGLLEYA